MKRLGIFVDVSNLYYCVGKKHNGKKVDYSRYVDFVRDLGDIQIMFAYGAQLNDEANSFIKKLRSIGFMTKYKKVKEYNNFSGYRRKADWDVGISMDIVRMIQRMDILILGSADGDLEPLVSWVRDQGVDVIVFASRISQDLKKAATKCIEITPSMLETENEPVHNSEG